MNFMQNFYFYENGAFAMLGFAVILEGWVFWEFRGF